MVCGIGYAWTSPSIPKLNGNVDPQNNPLSRPTTILEDSWITALQNLGAAFSPLFIGIAANKYGRKKTLIVFSLPMMVSNIILIFANSVSHFYVARFLVGIGTGCVFSVVPLYVAEISQVTNRGFTSMFLGLMITSQQLFVYVIGPYTTISTLAKISLIPSVLFLLTFGFFIPESPYYFVMIGNQVEAEKSLAKLRQKSKSDVLKELTDIIKSVEQSKTEKSSLKDLIKSKVVTKCLLTAVGLMFFQQFTGILAIVPYLQTIFDATNSSIPADVSVMMVGLVQFITTAITSRIVDKVDRKILLIASNSGILFSLICLGTYFYLQTNQFNVDAIFWLPIASIILYIICFNFGIGPIPWTIVGEIFPPNLKTHLNGIVTFLNIIFGFLIAMFFPTLSLVLGMALSIWIFAAFTAVSILFIVYFLPETRGRSFLEIQIMFRDGRSK
ncbi:hypothetical protein NQ314_007787 [Rhamnusium bicolor]|uniref:Major facilitator superfamily (MFS) profile domain-containing protein n=1 Tax=Rhamnusium bicolor TaxID=1586634 RepID=A0AAV8YHA5_9CUCU|nr:hypothetical protein NQ314_007787 [Rhamnusium bicolor]